MGLNLSIAEILLISIVMLVSSALQGSVGYGFALVATPFLVLLDYRFVPIPFSLAALLLVVLMTWREKSSIDYTGLGWSLFGRIFGTALGALILAQFTSQSFVMVFAIIVLLAVVISISGVRFKPTKKSLLGAGFFSGLMGTVAAIGGPPMALVYQEAKGAQLRSTLSAYFIIGVFISSFAWVMIGLYNVESFLLALFLFPGTLAGYILSSRVIPYIDGKYLRPLVLIVAAISGLYVLISELVKLI